jgi:hypothetical protein
MGELEFTPVDAVPLNEQVSRRGLIPRVTAVIAGAASAFRVSDAVAEGIRELKKEGVQLVDREIPGMTFEANHNPFIADGTLRLHVCFEDHGEVFFASRQLNKADGTTPGYLVTDQDRFDNSCVDYNAVTGQAKGEIDEVLLSTDESDPMHVYRITRHENGELQGSYMGREVVDFSHIKLRDPATPQP